MSATPDGKKIGEFLKCVGGVHSLDGQSVDNAFPVALADAVRMLRELNVEFVLFGALAVAAYVEERRTTMDIDFVAREEHRESILARASRYGFTNLLAHDDGRAFLKFEHELGIVVDIICSSEGFADTSKSKPVSLPGLGLVPIAAKEDLLRAKLRTQDPIFNRKAEKRLTDRSDLVALLRTDPVETRKFVNEYLAEHHSPREISVLANVLNEADQQDSSRQIPLVGSIPALLLFVLLIAIGFLLFGGLLMGIIYLASLT